MGGTDPLGVIACFFVCFCQNKIFSSCSGFKMFDERVGNYIELVFVSRNHDGREINERVKTLC